MDTDTVWRHIDDERAWLADLLESLPDDSWRQPSLCEGWTVRDVAAHLAFAQTPVRELLWPAVRAGFRYDAIIKETALRSPLTHQEIAATLRGFVGSRRKVAFITDLEPLIDVLVHNQDISRPLGVEHPMPPEAAAAAADRVLSTPRPIRRWRPPAGVRLIATDVAWAYGTGEEVRAPMQDHLLALTGRIPIPTGSR
ncbi:maleylpyruvate isomerase family mycothiol-dependent enzyme [Nocardioides sp. GY 10113]|uniref:maleylpyruvate isomerase family mycothiol-dependent enzyme n=1 Tax=Nocardioides sp. GY 10113 TaxID=2569761 RepID=UPI0010A869DC|nr:maleylpyruvate isomerase family mycothiol-dependent enzyme [Nocardioides sp. GY 10113]TIC87381.1 maleylpyruvate isomerase family mycothiol-dependent enzyme [Nocardioides sp. GY 10113]